MIDCGAPMMTHMRAKPMALEGEDPSHVTLSPQLVALLEATSSKLPMKPIDGCLWLVPVLRPSWMPYTIFPFSLLRHMVCFVYYSS